MSLLSWEKPKKVRSSAAHAATFQADGAPPGTYVQNMSSGDMAKWKAKLVGVRGNGPLQVEIRKTTRNGTQMLIKVSKGGFRVESSYYREQKLLIEPRSEGMNVHISANGPLFFTFEAFKELQAVVDEGQRALDDER